MKGGAVLSLCAMALLVLVASPGLAQAAAAGSISFTQTFQDATQTFANADPCTGVVGSLTITFNGVAHGNVLTSGKNAGTGWFTFTATGTFVLVPSDPTKPTDTGMFTVWDGENFNLNNFAGTSILVIQGTRSDGTSFSFHEVAQFTVSGTGTVTISFDMPTCG